MEQRVINEAQNRGYEIQNMHGGMCDLLDRETGLLWKDAPLEDVERYIMDRLDGSAIYPSMLIAGLALDRYDVIGNFWFEGKPVLLMRSKQADFPRFCVYGRIGGYGGSRYFRDFNSAMTFACIRYGGKRRLSQHNLNVLDIMQRKHLENGTPIRWADWERMAH